MSVSWSIDQEPTEGPHGPVPTLWSVGASPVERPDRRFTDILGVRVTAANMPTAIETIENWVVTGSRHYVAICAVHTIMECHRDPALRDAVNGAGLRLPDGMPLVWLSRRSGNRHVERVCGPDLMLALCERSTITGHRHFFHGGGPEVADLLASRLKATFPGLQVAGTYSPPMRPAGAMEDEATIGMINASGADVVWVGLGSPKQDWWVANHRSLLDAPVVIAVGAAFDFHSGRVRRAPVWMQRHGVEWLFRLSQDPRRLWKRTIRDNGLFAIKVLGHKPTIGTAT